MSNILLPSAPSTTGAQGFSTLLEVFRRARISGMKEVRIYGTDRVEEEGKGTRVSS
jgi:hypothetical protein